VRLLTFQHLKWASFAHSTVYACLLICWIGGIDGPKVAFGWAHGIGWMIMCVLALAALQRRVISMRLAVAVAVIGAVGPFVGSLEFVRAGRRRCGTPTDGPARYSHGPDGR
jgi:hypothetical protein